MPTDFSKIEKKEKKKGKKDKKEKSKEKDQNSSNSNKIDYSKLTDAEYEALFLQKFMEKQKNQQKPKAEQDQTIDHKSTQTPPQNSTEISLKEITPNLTQNSAGKISQQKPVDNKKSIPKYGVKFDFSWLNRPKTFIRHCPQCNFFLKTENYSVLKCSKCGTPMVFSIHCKSCNLWFDVKTPKRYPCPRCGQIISQGD